MLWSFDLLSRTHGTNLSKSDIINLILVKPKDGESISGNGQNISITKYFMIFLTFNNTVICKYPYQR